MNGVADRAGTSGGRIGVGIHCYGQNGNDGVGEHGDGNGDSIRPMLGRVGIRG